MFDINAFTSETVSAELATKRELIPQGEYIAMVESSDDITKWFRSGEIGKGERIGQPWSAVRIPFVIDKPELATKLNRQRLVVGYDFMLDLKLNPGTGQWELDTTPGQNHKLGAVRAALGQNNPGQWSWPMLRGAGPCLIRVVHGTSTNNNQFEEVAAVSPIKR